MSFESSYFNTEDYGVIGLTTSPIDEHGESDAGTTAQLSQYDFSSNDDKTWGLATKFYILSSIANHNSDNSAHEDLFNNIFSEYSDTIVSGGKFLFNSINDRKGNAIYANGMITYNDGADKGYIVTSSKRNASFDELENNVQLKTDEIHNILDSKQDKLVAGENIDINPTTNVISAKDTIYVLPEATKTTLGGVYLDNELNTTSKNPISNKAVTEELNKKQDKLSTGVGIKLSNDNKLSITFGKIENGDKLPITANDAKTELAKKQNNLYFAESYFTSSDDNISIKFGKIADASTDIVSSGDIYNELNKKQDNLSFDEVYFSKTDDNHVNLKFGEIEQNSDKLVKSSDIYNALDAVSSRIDEKAYKISTNGVGLTSNIDITNNVTNIGLDFGKIEDNNGKPVIGSDIYNLLQTKQNNLSAGQSIKLDKNSNLSVIIDKDIIKNGENPVLGKTIYEAFNQNPFSIKDNKLTIEKATSEQYGITKIDDKLDAISENPVQNKIITKALSEKQKQIINGTGIIFENNKISLDFGKIEKDSEKIVSANDLYNEFEKYQPKLTEGSGIKLSNNDNGTVTISVTSSLPEAQVNSESAGTIYLTDKIEENSKKAITAGAIFDALSSKQDNITVSEDLSLSDNKISINYGDISDSNTSLPVKGSVISDALNKKQDKIEFDSTYFDTVYNSDLDISSVKIKLINSIEKDSEGVPSRYAILTELKKYQKTLTFNTTEFDTTTSNNQISISAHFGDITSPTSDGFTRASDAYIELAKKQPLTYFSSSPFVTSERTDEKGGYDVSIEYGTISENSNLPVKASDVYDELNKKQDKFIQGENINIYEQQNDDGITTSLYISAKDTVYQPKAATETQLGEVLYGTEILEGKEYVVPASSIKIELDKKQDTISVTTGLKLNGTTLSLDYGNLSSVQEGDDKKPVNCKDARDLLLTKQTTLCAGDNIILENKKDDNGNLVTYISEKGYILPTATTTVSGGVYFSDTLFEKDGNYTVPAKTIYNSLLSLKNSIQGSDSISVSQSEEKITTLNYYQPNKINLAINFGKISDENITLPVKGSDIDSALSLKQDNLHFDSNDFITSNDNTISINYADTISINEARPAKSSTIYNFITNTPISTHYIINNITTDYNGNKFDTTSTSIIIKMKTGEKNILNLSLISLANLSISEISLVLPDKLDNYSSDFYFVIKNKTKFSNSNIKLSLADESIEYVSNTSNNPLDTLSGNYSICEFHFSELFNNTFLIEKNELNAVANTSES